MAINRANGSRAGNFIFALLISGFFCAALGLSFWPEISQLLGKEETRVGIVGGHGYRYRHSRLVNDDILFEVSPPLKRNSYSGVYVLPVLVEHDYIIVSDRLSGTKVKAKCDKENLNSLPNGSTVAFTVAVSWYGKKLASEGYCR